MAKKGLTQANILRSNNTTSTGYGIVYADEIIGGRSVKTRKDLDNLPDWVLGEDDGLDIGTTCYVQDEDCQYIYGGNGWYKSFKFIGLPVNAWYAYTTSAGASGELKANVLDIANFIKSDDLYMDVVDSLPHPFSTIVVFNQDAENNSAPVAYITLFASYDSRPSGGTTIVASAKVFGAITNNTFPKTPNFNNINYYEGSCKTDTSTKITNWELTGGIGITSVLRKVDRLTITGNTIKTSEIDFTAATLQKFNNSVSDTSHNICAQYSVVDATHNNIVGQMLLIGDSMGHMVTEILITSATLKNGVINWNEHSDTVVNTYIRRNHVKEGGNSSIAVGSWSTWTYYSGEGQFNDFKILVAKELNKKVNTSDIVQQTGDSTTSVMSQKAVSHELATKADTEQVNNSLYNLEKKIGDRVVVNGNVTNLPDEEDLTSVKKSERDVLRLADRSYAPENFSGKGYKILRKNIVDGKNILTQDMINQPNTIYEIRYYFDLNGVEINIPNDCSLIFNGGTISNGFIKGNLKGTFTPDDFGAKGDGITDDGYAIVNVFNLSENIELKENKTYLINNKIFDNKISIENKSINIIGNNSTIIIGEKFAEKDTNVNAYKGHTFIKINNVNIKAIHLNFKVLTENLYTETFTEENYLDGDFSLFNVAGTSSINFDNVNSFCEKKRNNLTFLFILSESPIVKLINSNIYHDTDSSRGGCIWYMTKGGTQHTLYVDNCNFYNNTADEDIVLTVINEDYSCNNISITNSNFNMNKNGRNSSAFIIYNAPENYDISCNILVRNCTFNAFDKKLVILRPASKSNCNINIENSNIKTTNSILAYINIPNPVYFNNCNINIEDVGQEIACIVPDKCGNVIYNINYINCIINCPYLWEKFNGSFNKKLLFKDCIIYTKARLSYDNAYYLMNLITTIVNSHIYTTNNIDSYTNLPTIDTSNLISSVKTSTIKNSFINNDFIKDSGILSIHNNKIFATLLASNKNSYGSSICDNSIIYDRIDVRVYDNENAIESCDFYVNKKRYSLNRNTREPNLFYAPISISNSKIGLTTLKIIVNNKLLLTKKVYNNSITNEIVNNELICNNITGTFANKPTSSDNISIGFAYFCTDKQTSEGESDGIMIYYKGNNVWVDALGRVVS